MPGAGISTGPRPWWQDPLNAAAYQNLLVSAPPGYTYDPIKMDYIPTSQSAPSKNALYDQVTGAIGGLTGGSSAAGGGGGSVPATGAPPSVQYGTAGGGASTGAPAPIRAAAGGAGTGGVPDISGSQDAAFARAKDKAGNLGRASVTSLNDEMAGRGALGSTMTNNGLSDRISAATNVMGDVNTAQMGDAFTAASHQQDLANTDQNIKYQGDITQRGQDISMTNASAALAQQKQMALLTALKGLDPSGGGLY
jgi:hypothetical protein